SRLRLLRSRHEVTPPASSVRVHKEVRGWAAASPSAAPPPTTASPGRPSAAAKTPIPCPSPPPLANADTPDRSTPPSSPESPPRPRSAKPVPTPTGPHAGHRGEPPACVRAESPTERQLEGRIPSPHPPSRTPPRVAEL